MSKIKHLYVNGDSFAFGQELGGSNVPPEDFYTFTDYMRQKCYSGLIADHYGIDGYLNCALPGGSNDRCLRTTLEDLCLLLQNYDPSELFVMISITHAHRREFREADDDYSCYFPYLNNYPPIDKWRPERKALWDIYTTYYDGAIEHAERYFVQLNSLQCFLEKHKIPYLLTNSMTQPTDFQEVWKAKPQYLQNTIISKRHYMLPFADFARNKHFQFGSENHPLEEGHRVWALHLIDYIDRNNLLTMS